MNDEAARQGRPDTIAISPQRTVPPAAVNAKPTASELLETPGALLSRGHLRELGLERRGVDAGISRSFRPMTVQTLAPPFTAGRSVKRLSSSPSVALPASGCSRCALRGFYLAGSAPGTDARAAGWCEI